MQHAILGTGTVGSAIADKLHALGHTVALGSRTEDNPTAAEWAASKGQRACHGTFRQIAAAGDVVWLAVAGQHALAVVEAAGDALDGKVVLDLTNPLDFSQGFPPRLFVGNDDSLGEQIQRAAPNAQVVKTFNTLSNALMVAPEHLPEPTDVFVAGEDSDAKAIVSGILQEMGHPEPVDMGGIEASRGLEAWLLLWTRLYKALGTDRFNLKLVRAQPE